MQGLLGSLVPLPEIILYSPTLRLRGTYTIYACTHTQSEHHIYLEMYCQQMGCLHCGLLALPQVYCDKIYCQHYVLTHTRLLRYHYHLALSLQ